MQQNETNHDKPLSLQRLQTIKARTGLSNSEIYRRIAAGSFPRPVKLGPRASAWLEHEITTWIAARLSERDKSREGGQS